MLKANTPKTATHVGTRVIPMLLIAFRVFIESDIKSNRSNHFHIQFLLVFVQRLWRKAWGLSNGKPCASNMYAGAICGAGSSAGQGHLPTQEPIF